ncbi:MAG: hypothetical protein ACXVAY_20705 [Mucilaginibacter sp.]
MQKEIYKIVENVLIHLSKGPDTPSRVMNYHETAGRNAIQFLIKHELVTFRANPTDTSSMADITPFGEKVLKIGVESYFSQETNRQEIKTFLEDEKLKKEVEKLSFDVKYAKPAFIISVISIICAVVAIWISLKKV